ncbi:hypothetical protein [Flavobacterium aquicola]|uniref:Carboxypeptidase-like protein n=1 Tax=Flavobacterium aquicola TaxID=1682742 RepID=A0A3E0EUJ3_9FLAO|nr:hypothetical protein [Flavobacterium aquicola]REH01828.1 hypothetical protein C8P67_101312 [Flavobacterium aquicola]
MKRILVWFPLIFCFTVFSQTNEKKVILLDVDTNEPIGEAVILVLKTKQVLMTNEEGSATFELKGGSNLKVTHSSYLPIIIKWASLTQPENIFYLKSKLNTLDDIVITSRDPHEIIKDLVANSIKTLTVPARLKVYAREFFKLNGNYTYFNDGLINFQLYREQKKVKSILLLEQNRSFGLIDEDISSDLLGYNLNSMMEKYYVFSVLRPLLDEKTSKKYNFVVKVNSMNQEYNDIIATPIPVEKTSDVLDDFKIVYDLKKKLIVEITAVTSAETLASIDENTEKGSENLIRSVFKTNYRIDLGSYYLVSSNEEINYSVNAGNEIKNIEILNNLITTNFNIQNFTYNDSQVFKDKTLFNAKNSILTDYWNFSGLTPTAKELEIINKISE